MLELLALGLTDDGLWCESSLHYHFTAIVPMVVLADGMRRTGYREDLFSLVTANGRTLKQPFDAMFGVLFPDGTIPPIGDAYGQRRGLAEITAYEWAWSAWQDGRYAWLLKRRGLRDAQALFGPVLPKQTPAPAIGSRLYPEHGYAFLRSVSGPAYWDSPAWCVFLTFDRTGVHANHDKLGIMVFGAGRLLIPDVEGKATVPHAFSSRIQKELNRGGLSQNTVMIDGQDQRAIPRRLELVEFRDLPTEKRVTAADREGLLYPGVRQQRTVCLTNEYVLDVFQVSCDSPRQIDWILHVLDEQAQPQPAGLPFAPMDGPGTRPWTWLRGFQQARTDQAWQLVWKQDDLLFAARMLAEPNTQIIRCRYPTTDEPQAAGIPMLIVRRHGASTVFAAMYSVGHERSGALSLERLAQRDGYLVYQVTAGSQRRVHLIPALAAAGR